MENNILWYFYIGWENSEPAAICGIHQNTPRGIEKRLKENKRPNLDYKIYGGFKTKRTAQNRLNKATSETRKEFFRGLI